MESENEILPIYPGPNPFVFVGMDADGEMAMFRREPTKPGKYKLPNGGTIIVVSDD